MQYQSPCSDSTWSRKSFRLLHLVAFQQWIFQRRPQNQAVLAMLLVSSKSLRFSGFGWLGTFRLVERKRVSGQASGLSGLTVKRPIAAVRKPNRDRTEGP